MSAEEVKAVSADYRTVGTASFDIFPAYEEWISHFMMDREPDMGALAQYHFGHLPVWVEGNAYFNGAKACKNEKSNLIDDKNQAYVTLKDGSDGVRLETNLFDLLGSFTSDVIDSDVLGYAFEPNQRFEDPDGSPITFNRDYFGNHREGAAVLPGPFACKAALEKALW